MRFPALPPVPIGLQEPKQAVQSVRGAHTVFENNSTHPNNFPSGSPQSAPASAKESVPEGKRLVRAGQSMAAKLRQKVHVKKERNESNEIDARTITELNEDQIRNLSSMLGISETDPNRQKEEIIQYFDKFVAFHQVVEDFDHHQLKIRNCTFQIAIHPDPEQAPKADPSLLARLGTVRASRLKELAQKLDMTIAERSNTRPTELAIHFEGSFTDTKTYAKDAYYRTKEGLGGTVEYAKECKEVAQIFSQFQQENPDFKIDLIIGNSAGGAKAQYFKAAFESRIDLTDKKPAMIVTDPQALNRKSFQVAIKDTPYGDNYDYRQPQGVAITLTNPTDHRKSPSLMGRMKALGSSYAGLIEVRLPVEYGDALVYTGMGMAPAPPKPMPLLGYHTQMEVYDMAIYRFAHS